MDLAGCLVSQSVRQSVMYLQQLREQDMTQRHHMKLTVQKKNCPGSSTAFTPIAFLSKQNTKRVLATSTWQNAPTTTANQHFSCRHSEQNNANR